MPHTIKKIEKLFVYTGFLWETIDNIIHHGAPAGKAFFDTFSTVLLESAFLDEPFSDTTTFFDLFGRNGLL